MKVNVYDMFLNEERKPFVEKVMETSVTDRAVIISPRMCVKIFRKAFQIDQQPEEHVYMMCLDTASQPLALFEVAHGTESGSLVSTPAVLRRVLLCGADSFILAHNHPSGRVEPSEYDIDLTKTMIKAAEAVRLHFNDHIIIAAGRTKYYSFYEKEQELWKSEN